MSQQKTSVRLLLVGDEKVGNVSILQRYGFKERTSWAGAPEIVKSFVVNNELVEMEALEMTSQQRCQSQRYTLYGNVNAVAIVLDGKQSEVEQKEKVAKWLTEINVGYLASGIHGLRKAPIYFLVNKAKSPLDTAAYQQAIDNWKWGNPRYQKLQVFVCSVQESDGIDDVFPSIAEASLAHRKIIDPISRQPTPSKNGGGVIEVLKKHKIWAGVSVYLLIMTIALVAALVAFPPVVAALALAGIPAAEIIGGVGGGLFLLWNAFFIIKHAIRKTPSSGAISPTTQEDRSNKHNVVGTGPVGQLQQRQIPSASPLKQQEQVPSRLSSTTLPSTHTKLGNGPQ